VVKTVDDQRTLGFIGLGAMGAPMAANYLAGVPTRVWNRTGVVASEHATRHGTQAVDRLEDLAGCTFVASCLPTTAEVAIVAARLGPLLARGTVWVDHTSGDPAASRTIAAELAQHGVAYLDAPVSGGTDGATAGSLTVMVGGDAADLERVTDVLDLVGDRTVHVGPVGAGHAVKAVNNALLATHLWAAAEGLSALVAADVDAEAALEVIATSSGASFATQRLIPERVLTRGFPATFALALLAKDVGIAQQVLADGSVDGDVLPLIDRLTRAAAEQLGGEVDHTALVQVVEAAAGVEIR
jgi:3-hydroxyisobutyrate dehydrogenase